MIDFANNMLIILFNPHFTYIWAITFGAIAGSFLNVLTSRYPKNATHQYADLITLAWPPSHCQSCTQRLKSWQLIPILSFICLGGRCYHCRQKIGWPTFTIEVAAVALTALATWQLGYFSPRMLVFIWICLGLSIIDYQHQLLPDCLTLGGMWLGLLCSTFGYGIGLEQAVLGAAGLYALTAGTALGYKLLRKQDGLGLGDCKLLAMFGAWLGFTNACYALLIGVVIALLCSVYLLLCKKMHYNEAISFGPFLAIGGISMLLLQ